MLQLRSPEEADTDKDETSVEVGEEACSESSSSSSTAAISKLIFSLRNCPGLNLPLYPTDHLDRFFNFLDREFSSLLPSGGGAADLVTPSNLFPHARHLEVSVERIELNDKFKKKSRKKMKKLEFVFRLGEQKATVACTEEGKSVGATAIFYQSEKEDVLHVDVFKKRKKGDKCLLGKTSASLDQFLLSGEEDDDKKLRFENNGGKVFLRVKFLNRDFPAAKEKVRSILIQTMAAKICRVLSPLPEAESAAIRESAKTPSTPCANYFIEVFEETMFEDQIQTEQDEILVRMNNDDDEDETNNFLVSEDLVRRTRTFRLPVKNLCCDVVKLDRVKNKRSSNFGTLQRMEMISSSVAKNGSARKIKSAMSLLGLTKKSDSAIDNSSSRLEVKKTEQDGQRKSYKSLFSQEVSVADIPIRNEQSKGISSEGIRWRLSWVAETSKNDEDIIDIKCLQQLLLKAHLMPMSHENRMIWLGELSKEADQMISLCWMFCRRDRLKRDWVEALLAEHAKCSFNNEVIKTALSELKEEEGDDLDFADYLFYCAKLFADFESCNKDEQLETKKKQQIQHAIGSLRILKSKHFCSEETFNSSFVLRYERHAKEKIALLFLTRNLAQLSEQAEKYALPTLKLLKQEFSDFFIGDFSWSRRVAGLVMECAVLMLEEIKEEEDQNGVLSFEVFQKFRVILLYEDDDDSICSSSRWKERFFAAFKRFLPIWAKSWSETAKTQVSNLLGMEKRRHTQQSWDLVSEEDDHDGKGKDLKDEEDEEWMNTHHVDCIFRSRRCELDLLSWPDRDRNVELVLDLIGRLILVLEFYLDSFLGIISEDGEFDKIELVVVLNSISHSVDCLKRMLKEDENDEKMTMLSERLNETAKSNVERFVDVFIQREARRMDGWIRRETLQEEQNGLFEHLSRLLTFLKERLGKVDEEDNNLTNSIRNKIFAVLDRKITEKYESCCTNRKMDGSCGNVHRYLEDLTQFREDFRAPKNDEVDQILHCTRLRVTPTDKLISDHLDSIHRQHQQNQRSSSSSPPPPNSGILTFHVGILEVDKNHAELLVQLKILSGVRPRRRRMSRIWSLSTNEAAAAGADTETTDEEVCNPCVYMHVAPSDNDNNNVERLKTPVYKNRTTVLFDWKTEDEGGEKRESSKHVYAMRIKRQPSEVSPSSFLVIELFDHSKFLHKYFLGHIVLPISTIPRLSRREDLDSNVRRRESPFFEILQSSSSSSSSWDELCRRRRTSEDPESVAYVGRIEKHLTGDRIRLRPSSGLRWVKNQDYDVEEDGWRKSLKVTLFGGANKS